jgi:hypothetical protein
VTSQPPPNQAQQTYYPPQPQGGYPPAGYPPGPPPGWQPQPPKKSHKVRNVLLAVVGIFVLIIVIAAVASGGSKSDKASNPGSTQSNGISTGLGSKDASKDIKLGNPDASDGFAIKVPVTATNSSSKRSDYLVDLSLESVDGKTQYDTATAFLENVEPGQTASDDAIFIKLSKLPAGAQIVVKTVQRTASS